jgi:hypothetical protein
MKSGREKGKGEVTRTVWTRNNKKYLEYFKGKNYMGDLDIDEKTDPKSQLILRNCTRTCGINPLNPGQGPIAGSCEHDNESSGPMHKGEFFDSLDNYSLFKKDFAQQSYLTMNNEMKTEVKERNCEVNQAPRVKQKLLR